MGKPSSKGTEGNLNVSHFMIESPTVSTAGLITVLQFVQLYTLSKSYVSKSELDKIVIKYGSNVIRK